MSVHKDVSEGRTPVRFRAVSTLAILTLSGAVVLTPSPAAAAPADPLAPARVAASLCEAGGTAASLAR